MEILLLLIYSFFVWLIFFRFKWLPWTFVSQVIVVTLPVVGLMMTILLLNIFAPSSHDVRVINYVVQIVPRVSGRVVDVPIEPDRPISKGQVLFKIDPTPYEQQAKSLEAKTVRLKGAVVVAEAAQRQLELQLQSVIAKKQAVEANVELARKRESQTKELADRGAGSKFDWEKALSDLKALEAELASAVASESQVVQQLAAKMPDGELATIAQARAELAAAEADLAEAKWKVAECTVFAPTDGTAVNLQLREGSTVTAFPTMPSLSFVENKQWVLMLFSQNELRTIKSGNEAEISLHTHPNRIFKCKVDSIIWASGTGQLPISGTIPGQMTQPMPAGKFAVRLLLDGKDKDVLLAAGASGAGAVFTDSGAMLHIIRKVMVRVGTKLDWLILKLH
ncbi:HlyD family secretion protein [Phragmitibacter flavus]|uniref:HlyD family secretion protein n=1 Tax=Phragmitibacter flavus TaxID=2576071 RepID=A0A5R8KIF1_9BACT|nr:efflux RND transporter periplasmic adaptor subunit [Phragmitibacter flavus]TLD72096.1 HlyD family secretion protein [Phragmitibacter flavus]